MKKWNAIYFISVLVLMPVISFGAEDIGGKTVTYGNVINDRNLENSIVRFVGIKIPQALRFQYRMRDNGFYQERILFKHDTKYSRYISYFRIELASTFFDDATAEYIKDDDNVIKGAQDRFKNIG